jgi:hypothetical protein
MATKCLILIAFPNFESVVREIDWNADFSLFTWEEGANADNLIRQNYFQHLPYYTDIKCLIVDSDGKTIYTEFDERE